MRAKRISSDEQLKLITECRQSGLSDYQWCQANEINPGTFYNWISRLRKKGMTIPDSVTVTEPTVAGFEPRQESTVNTGGFSKLRLCDLLCLPERDHGIGWRLP